MLKVPCVCLIMTFHQARFWFNPLSVYLLHIVFSFPRKGLSHVCSYERTCAVYKQECRDDGIVHITTGQAGFGSEVENFIGEEWSRFSSSYDWGYGRITIDGGKTLTFEQVLVGGEVVDMVKR